MGGSVSVNQGEDIFGEFGDIDAQEKSISRRRKGGSSSGSSHSGGSFENESGKLRNDPHRIFQRSTADIEKSVTLEMLMPNNYSEEVLEMLRNAIGGFFWLKYDTPQTDDIVAKNRVDMIAKVMQRETIVAGQVLIHEGGVGDKLFVVESGELAVTIKGEPIRSIGEGTLLGELALIYDSPRSATVTAVTDCVVYSLLRPIFKRVLAINRDATAVQRSR